LNPSLAFGCINKKEVLQMMAVLDPHLAPSMQSKLEGSVVEASPARRLLRKLSSSMRKIFS
jgi:hypothetical protein